MITDEQWKLMIEDRDILDFKDWLKKHKSTLALMEKDPAFEYASNQAEAFYRDCI